jgi:hypothetical protein
MKHILNHSNGALDMNVGEFRSSVSKTSWFDVSPIVMLRGGILGSLQLTFYNRFVRFLEQNREQMTQSFNPIQDLEYDTDSKTKFDAKTNQFIFAVKDDCDLLYKLANQGYFEQSSHRIAQKQSSLIHAQSFQPINVLLASIATSFGIASILTPIDILAVQLKYQKSSFNPAPESMKKSLNLSKVYNSIRAKEGLGLLFTMSFSSTFVRYMFVLTSFNSIINRSATRAR